MYLNKDKSKQLDACYDLYGLIGTLFSGPSVSIKGDPDVLEGLLNKKTYIKRSHSDLSVPYSLSYGNDEIQLNTEKMAESLIRMLLKNDEKLDIKRTYPIYGNGGRLNRILLIIKTKEYLDLNYKLSSNGGSQEICKGEYKHRIEVGIDSIEEKITLENNPERLKLLKRADKNLYEFYIRKFYND